MEKYKKVTKKMKEMILDMKLRGFINKKIAEELNISTSTVCYHSDPNQRRKSIARSIKNKKPRERKKYMKKYMKERYNCDQEFREKIKKDNRENMKKKYYQKKELSTK